MHSENMLYKFIAVLAVASITFPIVSAATDKIVCYHGTWAKYRYGNGQFLLSNIDPTLCTHIIYTFVGITTNGQVTSLDPSLDYNSGNLNKFTALKTVNPKLKTLLAIGGWSEGSTKYSTVAASAELRAVFIQSALDIVQTYGFDGFDLDWEYPAQRGGSAADVANFATLIKEFRETFDKHGLLLSAAVAAPLGLVEISYDVPSLSKYLDFINVMAYDLHASWDGVLGHNAPLYASSVDTSAASKLLNLKSIVESWIAKGADPQKLVLGIPFYGRTYTLASTTNVAIGAASIGAGSSGPYTAEAGMLGYNEIVEKQLAGGWTIVWDDEQKVPHMYKDNQWVGYDDPQSVTLKVEYAKSMSLSGVMVWSIETDDFRGASGTAFPLLSAINAALVSIIRSTIFPFPNPILLF
ncbi:unnamed protein product [Phaedon cochleariae]|uniref:chitinase n=1 Tax=Phaedon cochleariae TaxID=80249 RepID=A0A9N9SGY5_PHACE|nr:unnamed protein product [Phaedon cochleariae]